MNNAVIKNMIKAVKEQKHKYTVQACTVQWQQQCDRAHYTVPKMADETAQTLQ